MDKLVLRVTSPYHVPLESVMIDASGKSSTPTPSQLSDCLTKQKNCAIYLLVPGTQVFLTSVKLPKMSDSRLQKSLPFVFEERVAEDFNHLNFVLGKMENNKHSVAIFNQNKLNEWQSLVNQNFNAAEVKIHYIIPETLALPWQKDKWTIVTDNGVAMLKTAPQSGFAIELNDLWIVLPLIFNRPETVIPKQIIFKSELLVPKEILQFFKDKNIHFIQEQAPASLLSFMSKYLDKSINLLPTTYRRFLLSIYTLKNIALILFVVWITIQSLGVFIEYLLLEQTSFKLSRQITNRASVILNDKNLTEDTLKPRIQALVDNARSMQQGEFLRLIKILTPIFAKPEIKILTLKFSGKTFILTFISDQTELVQIKSKLLQRNLQANIITKKNEQAEWVTTLTLKEMPA